LIIHQFNEFATDPSYQDDGYDLQTTTDIEPTKPVGGSNDIAAQSGYGIFSIVKSAFENYKKINGFSVAEAHKPVHLWPEPGAGLAPIYLCVENCFGQLRREDCEGETVTGYAAQEPGPNLRPVYSFLRSDGAQIWSLDPKTPSPDFHVDSILGYVRNESLE
jgi:hypothetical protein